MDLHVGKLVQPELVGIMGKISCARSDLNTQNDHGGGESLETDQETVFG